MILGFDIGGTKCAVIKAKADGENIELLDKKKIAYAMHDGKMLPLIYDRNNNFYYF